MAQVPVGSDGKVRVNLWEVVRAAGFDPTRDCVMIG